MAITTRSTTRTSTRTAPLPKAPRRPERIRAADGLTMAQAASRLGMTTRQVEDLVFWGRLRPFGRNGHLLGVAAKDVTKLTAPPPAPAPKAYKPAKAKRPIPSAKKQLRKAIDRMVQGLPPLRQTPASPPPAALSPKQGAKLLTLVQAAEVLDLRVDEVASQLEFWPITPQIVNGQMRVRADEVARCKTFAVAYHEARRLRNTI